jgi:hypothetical protein
MCEWSVCITLHLDDTSWYFRWMAKNQNLGLGQRFFLMLFVYFYFFVCLFVCLFMAQRPQWARASSFTRFLDHTQWGTTVSRTPLDVISLLQRLLPDNTQHSQQKYVHALDGIRTHNLGSQAAADLQLRLCGHWDRLLYLSHLNLE